MKEATGELSTTMIAVVAIAAVLTIFTVFLLPALRSGIRSRTYCAQSTNCTPCANGQQICNYYEEDANTHALTLSTNTITCDCE